MNFLRLEKTPLLWLYPPKAAEGGSRLLAASNVTGLIIRCLTPVSLLYWSVYAHWLSY